MARWMAARGLHYEWMHVGFGPKGANFVGTTDTPLKPGEILRIDLGGSYKGYICDMSRSLAFGGQVSDAGATGARGDPSGQPGSPGSATAGG